MTKQFILAIDQGTTGTTCAFVDAQDFSFVASANIEFSQIYPKSDWVEHDLEAIWKSFRQSLVKVLTQTRIDPSQITAIGITNQRETICAFNRKGQPLTNAIVWQDKRTTKTCEKIQQAQGKDIHQLTGLPVDPYFSASKMQWLLANDERVKSAASENNLLFGTIDTFLIYRLTAGKSYLTDTSNASRTLLFDINTLAWSEQLQNLFGVSAEQLPQVIDSIDDFGVTQGLELLPDGIPITAVLGDQQAALFGQAGVAKGDMKSTYGTGAFLLLNTGEKPIISDSGLLTTVGFSYQCKTNYALEGSCYIAGAAVQWVRDNLDFIDDSPEIEWLASKSKHDADLAELLCFPFLSGLGSPYWRPDAKGAILGLTRKTSQADIARIVLEGIALSVDQLIEAFGNELGAKLTTLNVDGGAAANNLLLQMQANFSQLQVVRPKVIETTGYGAALAAAVGIGLLKLDDIKQCWQEDKVFETQPNNQYYTSKKQYWQSVLGKLYL